MTGRIGRGIARAHRAALDRRGVAAVDHMTVEIALAPTSPATADA